MRQSHDDSARFLDVALAAVEKSDAFINDRVRRPFTAKTKEDGSSVTKVDTGVERLIRRALRKACPGHDITGEELGSTAKASDYRWFIDPIDGTLSFKLGLPWYETIVFLCYQSLPLVAVVSQPALRRRYYALRGGGAYCNNKRIRISDVTPRQIDSELIATGDSYLQARALARQIPAAAQETSTRSDDSRLRWAHLCSRGHGWSYGGLLPQLLGLCSN